MYAFLGIVLIVIAIILPHEDKTLIMVVFTAGLVCFVLQKLNDIEKLLEKDK